MQNRSNNNLDFPVFTVCNNEYLKEDIEIMIDLQDLIDEISIDIESIGNELIELGNKLNFYINNIVSVTPQFNFKKNIIIFASDNKSEFYICDRAEISDYIKKIKINQDCACNASVSEELKNIKEEIKALNKPPFSVNSKQFKRITDLINEYNEMHLELEYCGYEFNLYSEQYNEIFDAIKSMLSGTYLADLNEDNDFYVELYDENVHDLLLTRNDCDKNWQLIYLRKEFKDEFLDNAKKD